MFSHLQLRSNQGAEDESIDDEKSLEVEWLEYAGSEYFEPFNESMVENNDESTSAESGGLVEPSNIQHAQPPLQKEMISTDESGGLIQHLTIQQAQPPLHNETPMRFFIEPSTFINLESLCISFSQQCGRSQNFMIPPTVQLPTSHFPMQPSTLFGFPLRGNSTHMEVPGAMDMESTVMQSTVDNNMFIAHIQTEADQAAFSSAFTTKRKFETVIVQNNKQKVFTSVNVTVGNDKFQGTINNYLHEMRDAA